MSYTHTKQLPATYRDGHVEVEFVAEIIPGEPRTRHHPGAPPDVDIHDVRIEGGSVDPGEWRELFDAFGGFCDLADEILEAAGEEARADEVEARLSWRPVIGLSWG